MRNVKEIGKNKKEDNELKIVEKLLNIINDEKLNSSKLLSVLVKFIYSLGASLENIKTSQTSEEVLLKYAENPRLGTALMAQALWIRDTWLVERKKKEDG